MEDVKSNGSLDRTMDRERINPLAHQDYLDLPLSQLNAGIPVSKYSNDRFIHLQN